MEKYIYTVSQIRTTEDEERVISIVKTCIDADEVEASARTSSIRITVSDANIDKAELERRLSYELSTQGYELILPEGVSTFIPARQKKSKKSYLTVGTAVVLALAVGLFCIMMTFGLCARYMTFDKNGNGSSEYMSELSRLDEFFRQYSYDGIQNESFKKDLLNAYIAYSGDIYAQYYTPEELEVLDQDKAGQFVGIGVGVVKDTASIDGSDMTVIRITSVYEDSPAQKAGICVGDMITHVGGAESAVSVDSIGYNEAVGRISGEEGTFAQFRVLRGVGEEAEFIDLKVERRTITKHSVTYSVCATDGEVGVVVITNFDYTTPTQFTEAIDTLKGKGCKYFVIDLRDNPGGYAESVVAVLSYFLDNGDTVMTLEDKNGKVTSKYSVGVRSNEYFSIKASDIGKYKGTKLAVLVNGNTASAAELFTATVMDYELGTVVGEKTYGKGCLQTTYSLKQYGLEGALKLTTHMYFSKSHMAYHGIGITPDLTIEPTYGSGYAQGQVPHGEDNQLIGAIAAIK